MLRTAIIGCGRIADQHVHAIRRITGSEVVAVCDREGLMARQLAERLCIPEYFDDVGQLLRAVRPDVVHITTPPQSHYSLARQCLDAGSHVYVEKPFTIDAAEADSLIAFAEAKGLRITAGHNCQFTPEMIEMRRLLAGGFLGGPPRHLESYWSYDLGDLTYVGPIIGNQHHWVRQLPGQLLQNIISHGIARLAEFLTEPIMDVHVVARQSDYLRQLGGDGLYDELRVLVCDANGMTATFCFSTQIRPGLNQLRIFGPQNSVTVDCTSGSVVQQAGRSYKSYLTFLIPPIVNAREQWRNFRRNFLGIARQRLHHDSGMKEIVERFHRSLEGAPPPLSYREIALTARLMDAIFAKLPGTASPVARESIHA